jgi:hypothetical protein
MIIFQHHFTLYTLSIRYGNITNKVSKKQSHNTPMEAWGERMCRSYSFTTLALNGGEWSASRPGHTLLPGKGNPVPIVQEAGQAYEPVWTQVRGKISCLCWGWNLDHPIVQPDTILTELPRLPNKACTQAISSFIFQL